MKRGKELASTGLKVSEGESGDLTVLPIRCRAGMSSQQVNGFATFTGADVWFPLLVSACMLLAICILHYTLPYPCKDRGT